MGSTKKARSKTAKQEAITPKEPATAAEKYFGVTLLQKVGEPPRPTATLLQKKSLVGVYFAASDDKACQEFTLRLKEFYTTTSDDLEIVYVSSDAKIQDFDKFFADMPWLAFPTSDEVRGVKNSLAKALAVSEIPNFIVLAVDSGKLVADECVKKIQESEDDKALLEEWKTTEPMDIHEAVQKRIKGTMTAGNFLKTSLRNAIIMFILLQGGTFGVRYFKKLIHGSPLPRVPPKTPMTESTPTHTEF